MIKNKKLKKIIIILAIAGYIFLIFFLIDKSYVTGLQMQGCREVKTHERLLTTFTPINETRGYCDNKYGDTTFVDYSCTGKFPKAKCEFTVIEAVIN